MLVMKFGGSSINDEKDIHRILSIIQAHLEFQPIVVISAFSQVTNQLEKIAYLSAQKKLDEARKISESLFERHATLADRLLSVVNRDKFYIQIGSFKKQILDLSDGLTLVGECTARTIDQMSSYGERLSSQLFTLAAEEMGMPVELVGVEEFLFTNSDYGNAIPLFDEVKKNIHNKIKPLPENGIIPIVPGFIGVNTKGIWTTMGRESSDYTAALLAAFTQSKEVQLWKGVDGIQTTDPLIVSNTFPVKQLSYDEALELSTFGAKILHPRTILPLIESDIPIVIKNINRPDPVFTTINHRMVKNGVKSITYMYGVDMLRITSSFEHNGKVRTAHLDEFFQSRRLNRIVTLHIGRDTVVLAPSKNINGELVAHLGNFGEVNHKQDTALIGIVGEGIGTSPEYLTRFTNMLESIHDSVIVSGASTRSICGVVPNNLAIELVKKLHAEFFEYSIKTRPSIITEEQPLRK